ncbi:MAG: YicC/YloC family endoribonuclease, partial [Syntrophorhabdus sp.]
MPNSMTGFAKIEKEFPGGKITSEARGLNSRYLEMNIRLPKSDFGTEQKLRDLVKKYVKRGKIDISIKSEKSADEVTIPGINHCVVEQYVGMARDLKDKHGIQGDLTIENMFGLKDVFIYEESNGLPEELFTQTCAELLAALNTERAKEGQYIAGDLVQRMD